MPDPTIIVETLGDLWLWLSGWVLVIARISWAWVEEHPGESLGFLAAFLGLAGTTVQSGWQGVLFRWGRVRGVLQPGFHLLILYLHHVRKRPTRSVTLDIADQAVTTADGLVYRCDANLVYRVTDPVKSFVEIDDLTRGLLSVVAMAVRAVVATRGREHLRERQGLDEALAEQLRGPLERWGVSVESAGFTSLAPDAKTQRVTQMRRRVEERRLTLELFAGAGLSMGQSLALLGADRRLQERVSYRQRHAPRSASLRGRAEALLKRGIQLLLRNRKRAAIAAFDRSLRLEPSLIEAFLYRGIAYHRDLEPALSLRDLKRFIALRPDHPRVREIRALIAELAS